MQPITVTDSRTDASGTHPTCTIDQIPAYGASGSCVIDYQVTAADVAAGSTADTVTAVYHQGDGESERTVTSAPVTVPRQDGAEIGLTSWAGSPSYSAADQELTYNYEVANDGDQPLTDVSVADTVHGETLDTRSCHWNRLGVATGNLVHCWASYHVRPADVRRGYIQNGAVATAAVEGTGERVSARHTTTIHLARTPAIGLSASAQPPTFSAAGQPVTYTYTVANDGDSDLTGVHVSETIEGSAVPVTCDGNQLDAGSPPLTCQAAYDVTQADLNRGTITSDATATATGFLNDQPVRVSQSASDTITRDDQPAIGVAATASASSFAQAGTEISYVYDVTNTGNTPLTGISVSDSHEASVSCAGATALAPGASERCLAAYRTTAADLAAGHVSSTVTARGRTAAGHEVAGTATLRIPAILAPGLSILKTASPASFGRAGDRIAYYYQVTNTGTVPVTGVTVTDSRLRGLSCPLTALAPGEHMVCTAAGVVTAADLARGSVANVARVTGTAPGGRELARSTMAIVPASRIASRVSPFLRTVPVTG